MTSEAMDGTESSVAMRKYIFILTHTRRDVYVSRYTKEI